MAILLQEDDAQVFAGAMDAASVLRMSAASLIEAFAVVNRKGFEAHLERLIDEVAIRVEPVTARQARIAGGALRQFGRGTGHPARLNFGDSFPYALSVDLGEPLLFKGQDFAQTDVRSAL